jgi:prepilin-type N-terminal cleavage/methylation domain-containing protein
MKRRSHRAFSLIEVLVAATVFAILLALFLQMTSGASELTGRSKRRMDSLVDARSALDRVGFDLDQRVRDGTVPVLAEKQAGSDALTFYAASQAGNTNRPVSSVSYRVKDHLIQRGVQATAWSGTNVVAYNPSILTKPAEPDFDSLATAVFRMECSFLLKSTHSLSASPPASWDDVAAILVAVAVVDRREFAKLSSSDIDALASAFPDAVDGSPMLPAWDTALAGLNGIVPAQTAAAVRIYQRCFSLE